MHSYLAICLETPKPKDSWFQVRALQLEGLAECHLEDVFSLPLLCPNFCQQLREEVQYFRQRVEGEGEISPGAGQQGQQRARHTSTLFEQAHFRNIEI